VWKEMFGSRPKFLARSSMRDEGRTHPAPQDQAVPELASSRFSKEMVRFTEDIALHHCDGVWRGSCIKRSGYQVRGNVHYRDVETICYCTFSAHTALDAQNHVAINNSNPDHPGPRPVTGTLSSAASADLRSLSLMPATT